MEGLLPSVTSWKQFDVVARVRRAAAAQKTEHFTHSGATVYVCYQFSRSFMSLTGI